MKPPMTTGSLSRRALSAAALAMLAACHHDGSSGTAPPPPAQTYSVSATVSGLTSSGLALTANGKSISVASGASTVSLISGLASGSSYTATVATQPQGENCTITNGSGTIASANVTNVTVSCALSSYALGGTISGLSASGLVLANGADTLAVSSGTTTFTLPTSVAYGSSYAVLVKTQPTGASCTVSNGSGTMPAAAVSNVAVACITSASFSKVTFPYSFTGINNAGDGSAPWASLVQASDGMFYGTTNYGGAANRGTLFRFNPLTNAVTILHSFGASAGEGSYPAAALVLAKDGKYYGTTSAGGAQGNGTLYQVDLSTGTVTLVYSFSNSATDGASPLGTGPLVSASDGMLYGTTSQGGGSQSLGTVFRFDPATHAEAVLHSFSATDGTGPYAGLIQAADGALYGTTTVAGDATANCGTVYRIDPATSGFKVVHAFLSGTDGCYGLVATASGQGSLVLARDGKLYGVTAQGGSAYNPGSGTIYSVDPATLAYSTLYSLIGGSDGKLPVAGLTQAADGKLYGTTTASGPIFNGAGTVFGFDPVSHTTSVVYAFNPATKDGINPFDSLVQGTDGKLYGTTVIGGANNLGTIFVVQ